MTDASDTTTRDWRDTVFLPKTDFPMKAGLAAKEPGILDRWQKIGVYQRLREQRQDRRRFILHDGPPYANGDIHMGHAMNKEIGRESCRERGCQDVTASVGGVPLKKKHNTGKERKEKKI